MLSWYGQIGLILYKDAFKKLMLVFSRWGMSLRFVCRDVDIFFQSCLKQLHWYLNNMMMLRILKRISVSRTFTQSIRKGKMGTVLSRGTKAQSKSFAQHQNFIWWRTPEFYALYMYWDIHAMHLQVKVQVYTWLSERKINILFFNY